MRVFILRGIACFLLVILTSTGNAQTGRGAGSAEQLAEAGRQALVAGRYDLAERAFTQLQSIEPNVAEIHASLGAIYYHERKFQQAVTEIRRAQALKPGLPRLDSLLAVALAETGDTKQALPGLAACFANADNGSVRRMCGLQLMRAEGALHQEPEAVRTAIQMNQLYADDAEVLYNTAKVAGNYAYLTMRRLAEKAPGSVWRHLAAAEAYESQGATDEAINEYQAVLVIEPARVGVHYRIGRTLLAKYHASDDAAFAKHAAEEFHAELKANPANANAAYELGEMARQAGSWNEAAVYFHQALEQHPEFVQANSGLAAVYIAQGKPKEALAPLTAALAIDNHDEVCWYRLAQVDRMLGDKAGQQDALRHFEGLHALASARNSPSDSLSEEDVTPQQLAPGEKK